MPTGINPSVVIQYSSGIIGVINGILVPVLIAIAFIVFLWGIYKYFILGATNEGDKGEGRQFALWGIIGFVIISSLWGLVNLVMGTFGLSVGQAPPYPTIGGSTGATGSGSFIGSAGSDVFGSNGSLLGQVNSSGNIVNNAGQVIGRIINGQPYDPNGNRMVGSTVSNDGDSSTNNTPADYDFADIPIPDAVDSLDPIDQYITTQTECYDESDNVIDCPA